MINYRTLRLCRLVLCGLAVVHLASGCAGAHNIAQKYNFSAPPGSRFTDAQKLDQIAAGKKIVSMVSAACRSGAAKVTIPPGNYRFGSETWGPDGPIYPVEFDNLRRDAAHPFSIFAKGATFWFDLLQDQSPTCHFCLGFNRCSHIILDGLIVDRGTRGNIEGRITRIDYDHNRIEIALCDGVTVPATFNNELNQRILPFKADGTFCAPLYALQAGGVHLKYTSITPGTGPQRYWVTPADSFLLTTNRDKNWIKAYGPAGTLTVGDGLSLFYTVAVAIGVEECDRMTFRNVSVYLTNGRFDETGGYGAHEWLNCYAGPRPGTNQWQGGEGFLCNSMKHGSTYDNFTHVHTTDDVMNIHGYWGYIKSVTGNDVTFTSLAADAAPGDTVLFYDNATGSEQGAAVVSAISGKTVTLDRSAARFADAIAEWPSHECAGWTIQNCMWSDDYQRLLIQSGPGTVKNCRFTRLGSCIEIKGYFGSGNEGGIPKHITIANNVFTNVAPAPLAPTVYVGAYTKVWQPISALVQDIRLTGNIFNYSGGPPVHLDHCTDCTIALNTFNSPLIYTGLARPSVPRALQPVQLMGCEGVNVSGNTLFDPGGFTAISMATGSKLLGVDPGCKNITLNRIAVR